jgi:hypothetical protein
VVVRCALVHLSFRLGQIPQLTSPLLPPLLLFQTSPVKLGKRYFFLRQWAGAAQIIRTLELVLGPASVVVMPREK